MNMIATEETVLGDFSRVALYYGDRKAVFRKQKNQFLVEYFREEQLLRQFRISRVIGWRYEQDYVGFQTRGPEPANDPVYENEIRLGFSYSVNRRQWFPQSYLEPTEYPGSEYNSDGTFRHDPFIPTHIAFNERCARCHNTHISGPKAGTPDLEKHLNTCVECHQDIQSAQSAQSENGHSQHTPGQASCLDCHMPRIVQGFGLTNRSSHLSHRHAQCVQPVSPRQIPGLDTKRAAENVGPTGSSCTIAQKTIWRATRPPRW